MKTLFLLIALALAYPVSAAMRFTGAAHVMRKQGTYPCGVLNVTPDPESWSFWILRATTNAGGILGLNVNAANIREFGFMFNGGRSNSISFFYQTSGAVYQEFATAPGTFGETNVWVHVAFTFIYGTGSSAKFYKDGVQIAGAWVAGDGSTYAALNTTVNMTIGNDKVNNTFNGAMTDVARYSLYILTPRQVSTIARSRTKLAPFQAAIPTVYANGQACGYYTFDDLPMFTTQTGTTTNTIICRSPFTRPGGGGSGVADVRSSGSTASNCVVWPEYVTSYQPNN